VYVRALITALAISRAIYAEAPVYQDRRNLLVYQDGRGNSHEVRTRADWLRRRAHVLENMEKVMGPRPARKLPAPEVTVLEETRLPGYVRRKITYSTDQGDRVPAYLLIPAHRSGKLPAMLCLHQTTRIGKAEPAGLGTNQNLAYAAELAGRGYVTIAPDYPNFGEYKFDPYANGYASATMKGIRNHMGAVDVLASLPEVDRRRIGAIGHSLGGHNALFAAVFDERIAAVVTSCGFTSFAKYKGGDLTGWSHRGYMPRIAELFGRDPVKMPFDFSEILAAIAPRAVFVNAPRRDDNFEVTGVEDCVRAALPVFDRVYGKRDRLVAVYPDSAHEFPPEVRRASYDFLDLWLNGLRISIR
jgi:dienelactone hydrolase